MTEHTTIKQLAAPFVGGALHLGGRFYDKEQTFDINYYVRDALHCDNFVVFDHKNEKVFNVYFHSGLSKDEETECFESLAEAITNVTGKKHTPDEVRTGLVNAFNMQDKDGKQMSVAIEPAGQREAV